MKLQKIYLLALLLSFALVVVAAAVFVFFGNINGDEGWVLYAAEKVRSGQILYRDFPYFQAPLLPYLYGLTLWLLPVNLWSGRIVTFAMGITTALLSAKLAHSWGGKFAALYTNLTFASASGLLWIFTSTRTQGATALLAALAAVCLFDHRAANNKWRWSLGVWALLWATAVRISNLPALLFGLVLVLYRLKSFPRAQVFLVLSTIAQAGILFGPSLLAARERFWFDVISAQVIRGEQVPFYSTPSPYDRVLEKLRALADLLQFYPLATGALFIAVLLALLWSADRRQVVLVIPRFMPLLQLALFAMLVYLPNLAVSPVLTMYFFPSAVLVTIILSVVGSNLLQHAGTFIERGWTIAFLLVWLVWGGANSWLHYGDWLSLRSPQIPQVDEASVYLRSFLPEKSQVVTLTTYLPLQAGLRVPTGFEMASYSYFREMPTREAERYGLINWELYNKAVETPETKAVLLEDNELGILLGEIPPSWGGRALKEQEITTRIPSLSPRCHLVQTLNHFGQYGSHLYVFACDSRSPT